MEGYSLSLNYVRPLRVAIGLRLQKWAQGNNLYVILSRIAHHMCRESFADTSTGHAIRHTSVIDNDQLLVRARKCHFRFIRDTGQARNKAAFAALIFERKCDRLIHDCLPK